MTVPLVRQFTLDVTSQVTATDVSMCAGIAPFACVVTAVQYIPNGSQAGGAIANSRLLTLFNRGQGAATGTTVVAQQALTSGAAAGTLTDNLPATIALSGTTTFLTLAASDVLEWESLHRTNGLPDPGGRIVITYSRI